MNAVYSAAEKVTFEFKMQFSNETTEENNFWSKVEFVACAHTHTHTQVRVYMFSGGIFSLSSLL